MTDWQQILGEQKQQPYFQALLNEVTAI
ncbi:TPA: uracil-DNA glycosylase, partial [Candidatus Azambacteria bacterium]|nr:uracil-DNA glycosylase [Candidatus Azambacteria bacterium]